MSRLRAAFRCTVSPLQIAACTARGAARSRYQRNLSGKRMDGRARERDRFRHDAFPTGQAVRDPNKCAWVPVGPITGTVPVPTP